MRRYIRLWSVAVVLAASAAGAFAAGHVMQVYECPLCRTEAEFEEAKPGQHFCTGSEDRPHMRAAMAHKGTRNLGK